MSLIGHCESQVHYIKTPEYYSEQSMRGGGLETYDVMKPKICGCRCFHVLLVRDCNY